MEVLGLRSRGRLPTVQALQEAPRAYAGDRNIFCQRRPKIDPFSTVEN